MLSSSGNSNASSADSIAHPDGNNSLVQRQVTKSKSDNNLADEPCRETISALTIANRNADGRETWNKKVEVSGYVILLCSMSPNLVYYILLKKYKATQKF